MKDIYKNPILYFVLVPILIGLWPLLLKTVYLPDAEKNFRSEIEQYKEAERKIEQILTLDPDRLDYADPKKAAAEFDYANAVERTARICKISSKKYTISSKPPRKSRGRETQNAKVVLKDVAITKFAQFLSTIQLRWANLQCEKVALTKKKDALDTWKIDLDFKYYY